MKGELEEKEIKELKKKRIVNASEVIKRILGRPIKWVDYEDLPENEEIHTTEKLKRY